MHKRGAMLASTLVAFFLGNPRVRTVEVNITAMQEAQMRRIFRFVHTFLRFAEQVFPTRQTYQYYY
jgi:hypothetical protein